AHGLGAVAETHGAADVILGRSFIIGAKIIGQAIEARVQDWAVEALIVVEDDEFPVGFDVVDGALLQAEVLHAPGGKFFGKATELLAQRLGIGAEIQKDVTVPGLGIDRVERIILADKIDFLHVRSAEQAAIKRVGPAVIGALDAALEMAFILGADAGAAVA